MLISVIVPIYNTKDYLPQCIESIMSQAYEELEIILVDDGSTDESGEICEQYANVDERISVIHKKNAGLVAARKSGVALAHGDYVTFVDSDDWIDADMYEKMVALSDGGRTDVIACRHYHVYGAGTVGQAYYDELISCVVEVVAWVDKGRTSEGTGI